jgi:hypothetical protein
MNASLRVPPWSYRPPAFRVAPINASRNAGFFEAARVARFRACAHGHKLVANYQPFLPGPASVQPRGEFDAFHWTFFEIASKLTPVDELDPETFLHKIRGRLLFLLGDSVTGQLYQFVSCYLLSAARVQLASSQRSIEQASEDWNERFQRAMRQRAAELNASQANPFLERTKVTKKRRMFGRAITFPEHGHATLAYLNLYLYVPPPRRAALVTDYVMPIVTHPHHYGMPTLPGAPLLMVQHGLHIGGVGKTGWVNFSDPSDLDSAVAELAGFFEAIGGGPGSKSPGTAAGTEGAHAVLIAMETPPQGFDTPSGLYPGEDSERKRPTCATSVPPLLRQPQPWFDVVNWRNLAMATGLLRATNRLGSTASWRTAYTWRALAALSGVDAHRRTADGREVMGSPRTGHGISSPVVGPVDCTHLSPDALLLYLQVMDAMLPSLDGTSADEGERDREAPHHSHFSSA